jgi:hypothetical protein
MIRPRGQGQIGLDRIQFLVGYRQHTDIGTDDGPLIQQPGPFDSLICARI